MRKFKIGDVCLFVNAKFAIQAKEDVRGRNVESYEKLLNKKATILSFERDLVRIQFEGGLIKRVYPFRLSPVLPVTLENV